MNTTVFPHLLTTNCHFHPTLFRSPQLTGDLYICSVASCSLLAAMPTKEAIGSLPRQGRKPLLHCTINCPRIMFMPQTKVNVPLLFGVKVTTTDWLSGNARLILKSGNTISFAQVASVVRTKVTRAGTPLRSLKATGS